MTPSLPIPFHPAELALPALFDDLANPALSLREVAHIHHTTAESLALWMSQPDIADRLSTTDSCSTWRTRLIAKSLLPKVAHICAQILDRFNSARQTPPTHAPPGSSDGIAQSASTAADPTRAAILELRAAESARRAGTLLFQLARLDDTRPPSPRTRDAAEAPTPARAPAPPPSQVARQPSPVLAAIDSEIQSLLAQLISTLPQPEPEIAGAPLPVIDPDPVQAHTRAPETSGAAPSLSPHASKPHPEAAFSEPLAPIPALFPRRNRDQRHHSRRDSPQSLLAATGVPTSRPHEHWP